jgi:hypothetical protein
MANGVCNPNVNTEECNWDGGDCCGPDKLYSDDIGFFEDMMYESEPDNCEGCGCLDPGKQNGSKLLCR